MFCYTQFPSVLYLFQGLTPSDGDRPVESRVSPPLAAWLLAAERRCLAWCLLSSPGSGSPH